MDAADARYPAPQRPVLTLSPVSAHPKILEQIDAATLRVAWEDGHESIYAIRELRLACPCAMCKDEWSGKNLINPASVPQDLKLNNAQAVGNYAFAFAFSDGHGTGIYSFENLRGLCRCRECAP